jgi:CubicO group peptidase (beta-lactamase class C family)
MMLQACAYVNGELVLDLVGVLDRGHALAHKYDASSLQNVFSSSKAVASIVVAMLVDRGHLRYDTRIADIWPGESRIWHAHCYARISGMFWGPC